MKKTPSNLLICAMVFAVALVVANVITAKTVQTGVPLFGSTILVPSAVVCYCITFLMTDVIGEIWGRKEAQTVVIGGLLCQVVATVLILVGNVLPAADPAMQGAYEMLLGQNAVFVVASMAGYLLSQSWDVFVFHRLRATVMERGVSRRHRWIWNNASTMTSQAIDTVVFIAIAFGLGMGWFFDAALLPQLFAMMVGQYLCKLALAAVDTPVFYLLTRRHPASETAPASL